MQNFFDIPIATYTQAMRIAVKYSMEDVQVAITKFIEMPPQPREEISRLAFVAEFPSYFSKGLAIQVFTSACSVGYELAAYDVKPLMAYPAFVVLMVHYREGARNPSRAIWMRHPFWELYAWLNKQFESFGFKPQA
jgi:hypothetical protein